MERLHGSIQSQAGRELDLAQDDADSNPPDPGNGGVLLHEKALRLLTTVYSYFQDRIAIADGEIALQSGFWITAS
jgi:hypothetical protein